MWQPGENQLKVMIQGFSQALQEQHGFRLKKESMRDGPMYFGRQDLNPFSNKLKSKGNKCLFDDQVVTKLNAWTNSPKRQER